MYVHYSVRYENVIVQKLSIKPLKKETLLEMTSVPFLQLCGFSADAATHRSYLEVCFRMKRVKTARGFCVSKKLFHSLST